MLTMCTENTPISILLVSNNQQELKFYKRLLHDLGHEISSSSNPYHAFKLFQSYRAHGNPFGIALIDYLLPGMNGIDLARKFKTAAPETLMMLFPSDFYFEKAVKNDYDEFGGFTQEPDFSFHGLQRLINLARGTGKTLVTPEQRMVAVN